MDFKKNSTLKPDLLNSLSYEKILEVLNIDNNEIQFNKIYNQNCISFIDKMIENNILVDAIITDPPYNVSRKNNFKTIGRNGIDFGEWDKQFDQFKWLENVDKILKNGGSLIIFNDWKNIGEIAKFLETKGFEIKDLIRWVKTNPMPRNTNRRYVSDMEVALWAVKKGKWTFNKDENLPYIKPEYFGSPPNGKNRIHPTQKSSSVISNIIKTHTNEGDIIFDPFSGSGEISYNAFVNNRKYIATEINKNYFNGSISRFNKLYISPAYNHIGNKKRIISDLLNNFSTSKIDYFVDVFAGSGVVSANFNRANKYILNDNDKHVSDILEYLFNTKIETILKEINEVIDFYKLPRNSFSKYNDQYSTLKSDFNYNKKNRFNRVSMLFVLILFGFNQQIRVNSSGNFNIPAGKFFITDYQFNKIKDFVKLVKKVNAKIYNKDFVDLIKDIKKTISLKDCIFYFDPPYLITNGTYNASWNLDQENKLIKSLDELNSLGIKWVLSNQVFSDNKVNHCLLNFLSKNNFAISRVDVDYSNSSYHKIYKEGKTIEIIVRNF